MCYKSIKYKIKKQKDSVTWLNKYKSGQNWIPTQFIECLS